MSTFVERRFYTLVSALSTEVDEYVVPDGVELFIKRIGGNGRYGKTSVRIVWDYGGANTVLFSTSGDDQQELTSVSIIGDGAKTLAIVLDNDELSSANIGGHWIGKA